MSKAIIEQVTIEGSVYYSANQLKDYNPEYFYGCTKSPKKIVDRKNIPNDQYVYASPNKAGYKIYPGVVPSKAVLYLSKYWAETYIITDKNDIPSLPVAITKVKKTEIIGTSVAVDVSVVTDKTSKVPPLLHIEDECKFKDEDGNIIDIEVRGERTPSTIYFLASDVATGFDIPYLQDIIKAKDSSYIHEEDYVYFVSSNVNNRMQKVMYLTYEGILRVVLLTRSKKMRHFSHWIVNVVFTAQMGTTDKKEELAANILGVNVKSMRESLSTCSTSVPCVYLFSLGVCNAVRASMSLSDTIPGEYIIVKYGFTNDLHRRSGEHAAKYGKLAGVQLQLLHYTYIDPVFLSDAENDISRFFKDLEVPVVYETNKELVAVNPMHLNQVARQYKSLKMLYAGHTTEMSAEIERLKDMLERQQEKINSTLERQQDKHNVEMGKKDVELTQCMVELQKKNVDLEKCRTELEKKNTDVQVQAMENKYLKMMLKMKVDVDQLDVGLANIKL